MKVSGGKTEREIVVGNTFDKYGSANPIVRRLMHGFDRVISRFVQRAAPTSIHEAGCGEGYWTIGWHLRGYAVRGSDFSSSVIEMARQNAAERRVPSDVFVQKSIYDLDPRSDAADLVVASEVMEHLDDPESALRRIRDVASQYVILSVPREPLWRVLNLLRAAYVSRLGNTPGHIQHWSSSGFIRLVKRHFDIVEIAKPIPWTVILAKPRTGSRAEA
jgi:2-polyprenyl-3-methyl-5-hydroxy-6-metoxy-1,4-benzoquinol methylase